jgi:hypothetical protein
MTALTLPRLVRVGDTPPRRDGPYLHLLPLLGLVAMQLLATIPQGSRNGQPGPYSRRRRASITFSRASGVLTPVAGRADAIAPKLGHSS